MDEKLEALAFYRYIQEVLKTEGIDHITVHICPEDDQIEVNAVFVGHKKRKE
jgi:hypothetical protein